MPKVLTIVPCGQSKIWKNHPRHEPEKAENVYTGAPFKVNRDFAEKFSDKWMILSAKYGFIEPDFIITKDYNVTFKRDSTNPISLDDLKKQVKEKYLDKYELVVVLGGKDYSSMVKQAFANSTKVIAPAKGLPIGIGMNKIKTLTTLSTEEMLKRIMQTDE